MLAQLVLGPRSGTAEPVPQPVPARVLVRDWLGLVRDWMGLVEPSQSQERTPILGLPKKYGRRMGGYA